MRTHCHISEHLFIAAKARLEKLRRRRRRRRMTRRTGVEEKEHFLKCLEPSIGSKYTNSPKVASLTKRHRLTSTAGLQQDPWGIIIITTESPERGKLGKGSGNPL
jgi:hypothetical protein